MSMPCDHCLSNLAHTPPAALSISKTAALEYRKQTIKQQTIPSEFGLRYIPHKVVISADGTVVKNYDFAGTSLGDEVAKLK
jgi:hypothetical protein